MTVSPTSRFLPAAPEFYEAGGASFRPQSHVPTAAAPVNGAEVARPVVPENPSFLGENGLDFGDVLDAVNPLHHLPVIGSIYRALSGDTLAPAPRVAGGTLYGGPLGFAASLANVAVEGVTGNDIGANVLASFTDPAGDAAIQVAALAPHAGADIAAGLTDSGAADAQAAAAMLQQSGAPAACTAALPKVSGNRTPDAPNLSPAAFQALMSSIGAVPEEAAESVRATAAPAAASPVVPGASLEVHQLLQGYATDQGLALPLVRR